MDAIPVELVAPQARPSARGGDHGRHPHVGTRDPVTEDITVAGAARTLTQHRVKRLPVVDGDGRLVGIVSRKDLVTVFLRDDEDIRAEIVRRVFEGGIGIPVSPGTVAVDGVVDVIVSMSYRYDDTQHLRPDPMAIDITQAPRVR